MNYLVRICLIGLILISFLPGNAQEGDDAAKLLQSVTTKYRNYNAFYVDFKLMIEIPEEDGDQYQDGNLYVSDQKFKLDMGNQVILTDGKSTCLYMKDIKELQITDFDLDEEFMSPSELFTSYNTDYIYRLRNESSDASISEVEATPTDKNKPFFKVVMNITKDNKITMIKVFEKTGVRYTYDIKNTKTNPSIGEDFFKCDRSQFPDAEVVEDLR